MHLRDKNEPLFQQQINDQVRRARLVYLRLFPQHGVLPDFLIIGAARCGTSSLYRYLGQHPGVRLPTKKEIGFFRSGQPRPELVRYQAHFPLSTGSRSWITGEAYPAYIFDPASPQKISQALPHARLILMLRNPIDRAYSEFHYNRKRGVEPLETFEEALAREPERLDPVIERMARDPAYYAKAFHRYSYVLKGQYAGLIERWLEVFPRDQFLFVTSEAFFADVKAMLGRVYEFLGLPPYALDDYPVFGSGTYEPVAPETRRRLAEHFEPHNRQLYRLLGVDYGWDQRDRA